MRTRALSARRRGAALLACAMTTAAVLNGTSSAGAAIVATVPMGTASSYSVLGASTVTNTGPTTMNGSLGLAPGTSITGFPPGLVIAPGTTNNNNAAANQAQADLTAAYTNAAGRSIDATTTADLANLTLQPGVYSGPSKSALSLTGPLTLDGAGNNAAVFIFQTDSTLTTASSSTVTLINGAQGCNVFWLVGSSATLGTSSVFAGTILALTSITVTTNVTVRGRALARNGAVTLDSDTFSSPTCAAAVPAATTTTTSTSTTSTTRPTTTTSTVRPTTTSTTAAGSPATVPGSVSTTSTIVAGGSGVTTTTSPSAVPGTPTSVPELPRTGAPFFPTFLLAILALSMGTVLVRWEKLQARPSGT
jgi:hypothetical protein